MLSLLRFFKYFGTACFNLPSLKLHLCVYGHWDGIGTEVPGTDPVIRTRIRTKISRIPNTGYGETSSRDRHVNQMFVKILWLNKKKISCRMIFSYFTIKRWAKKAGEKLSISFYYQPPSPPPQTLTMVLLSVVDPWHFGTDLDPDPGIRASGQWIRILLFSSLTTKTPTKNYLFFCLLLFEGAFK